MCKWYEIVRITHSFEKGLVGCTAEYSMRSDGLIEVKNSGYEGTLDGKKKISIDKARLSKETNSKLQVSFFLNFWGDYWIVALDDTYRHALIDSSTSNYLWVLPEKSKWIRTFITLTLKLLPKESVMLKILNL